MSNDAFRTSGVICAGTAATARGASDTRASHGGDVKEPSTANTAGATEGSDRDVSGTVACAQQTIGIETWHAADDTGSRASSPQHSQLARIALASGPAAASTSTRIAARFAHRGARCARV